MALGNTGFSNYGFLLGSLDDLGGFGSVTQKKISMELSNEAAAMKAAGSEMNLDWLNGDSWTATSWGSVMTKDGWYRVPSSNGKYSASKYMEIASYELIDGSPLEKITVTYVNSKGVMTSVEFDGWSPNQALDLALGGTLRLYHYGDDEGGTVSGYYTAPSAEALAKLTKGEVVSESVSITIEDWDGRTTSMHAFSASYTGMNKAPDTTDDAFTIDMADGDEQEVSVNLLANDSDQDNENSDLSVVADSVAFKSADDGRTSSYGSLTISANGVPTFTLGEAAKELALGERHTEIWTYEVTDSDGGTSTAEVAITIIGENDAPFDVSTIKTVAVTDTETVTGTLAGHIVDPDGDGLKIVLVAESGQDATNAQSNLIDSTRQFTYGTVGQELTTDYGTLTLNEDLTFTFTANPNYFNEVRSSTVYYNYIVEDAHGAQHRGVLAFDVTGTNDMIPAQDDTYQVAEYGPDAGTASVSVDRGVLKNDGGTASVLDGLIVLGVSGFTGEGTVGTALQGKYGILTLNKDGDLHYEFTGADGVPEGATVMDTFTYTVGRLNDPGTTPTTATVSFETIIAPDAPWQRDIVTNAELLAYEGDVESVVEFDVTDTETLTGSLTGLGEGSKIVLVAETGKDVSHAVSNNLRVTSSFEYGTVGQELTTQYGTLILNEDLTFTFTANSDYYTESRSETVYYTYVVEDAAGNQHRKVLAFDVTGTDNLLPTQDDHYLVAEFGSDAGTVSASGQFGVLGNDGSVSSVYVSGVSGFTGEGTVGTALQGKYGVLTLNKDGSLEYEFTGADGVSDGATVFDTFTYTATVDQHPGIAPNSASITFETVIAPDAPWQRDLVTNPELPDII
jgi:VCBS repeat-containing protein